MADVIITAHCFPTANDIKGAEAAGWGESIYEKNLGPNWMAPAKQNFVISGFALANSDADLTVTIPAGKAFIAGRYVSYGGTSSITFPASSTSHLFLKLLFDVNGQVNNVAFEHNTTGTPPADSVKIAVAITDADNVTHMWGTRITTPYALPWLAPVAIASGSTRSHEGDLAITSNTTRGGVIFCRSFYLASGVTLTVDSAMGCLLICAEGEITINGTIAGNAAALSPAGGDGTDQPAGAGGSGDTPPGSDGGSAVSHGIVISAGGLGGQPGGGAPGAAITGSQIANVMQLFGLVGGASGGPGGNGTAGGRGGASIVLLACVINLGAAAVLNTSGANGANGGANAGGGGGGGAGNIWMWCKNGFFTDAGATFTQTAGTGGAPGANGSGGSAGRAGFRQIMHFA